MTETAPARCADHRPVLDSAAGWYCPACGSDAPPGTTPTGETPTGIPARDPLADLAAIRERALLAGSSGGDAALRIGTAVLVARDDVPRLLAGYDALLKAHKPVQIYADADGCGHECPPEPDWQADPDKAAVDAWDAYQDEHTYGTTQSGENDIRICMLTPDHQACPACSALVYSLRGDDEYVDASRCVALPLIAAALSGSETPS